MPFFNFLGEKISVTKDWFVVVCHNNNDELAKANSLRRQMDLIVAVVAPFAVGALLDAIPDVSGIVFICLWNAVTKFIEYRILLHVYRKDADLRQKRGDDKATTLAAECINYATDDRNVVINQSTELADSKQSDLDVAEKVPNANTNTELTNVTEQNGADNTNNITNSKEGLDNTNAEEKTKDKQNRTGTQQQQEENIFERLKAVVYGWKIYYRQKVSLAGLALALLYSTVLDFNAITTAYAVSVGFNKMYISICFGMGSLCGVFGSFSFPFLRRFLGLPRTGIVGGFIQLSFLSLCVFSIWMPGSPSGFYHHGDLHHRNTTGGENSSNITDNIHPGGVYASNITSTTAGMHISTIITEILPTSSYITTGGTRKLNISTKKQPATKSGDANISIWFLFAGIILSRAGLWIADITVTQLQQEYVPAEERGVVGGVQNALNSSFDLIHYVVTVALPYPHEFWVLILISVSAVGCSFITYIVFNIVFHRMLMANSTKESNTKL